MHIADGTLREKADGELPADELLTVETHLNQCSRCRERAGEIERRARETAVLFSELGGEAQPNTAAALARLNARRASEPARAEWRAWLSWVPAWRAPAWGAAAAVALICVLTFSGSARAAAQRFLSLLRVRNVVAVPVERPAFNEGKGKLLSEFLGSNVQMLKEEKALPVANREDAAREAGFAVRLPSALSETPELTVEGAREFQFTVDAQRAQTLIDLLGRPDLKLPEGINGAKIAVEIPRAVVARYGECRPRRPDPNQPGQNANNCTIVAQVPSPTIATVPELDLAAIAEIGLQLTGMTAEDARAFSRAVDWSSTLAIPVPTEVVSHQNVTVEGVQGILMTSRPGFGRQPRYALIWVKNGIVHNVGGSGNPSMAIPVAESLQ